MDADGHNVFLAGPVISMRPARDAVRRTWTAKRYVPSGWRRICGARLLCRISSRASTQPAPHMHASVFVAPQAYKPAVHPSSCDGRLDPTGHRRWQRSVGASTYARCGKGDHTVAHLYSTEAIKLGSKGMLPHEMCSQEARNTEVRTDGAQQDAVLRAQRLDPYVQDDGLAVGKLAREVVMLNSETGDVPQASGLFG